MTDLPDLGGRFISEMNIIAMDAAGHPAGFSSAHDKTFIYMTGSTDGIQVAHRTFVEVPQRWEI